MNESKLIEQVSRIINANYSNIYVIDIPNDKVYGFEFNISNTLVIKETLSYTNFIEVVSRFIHGDDISTYFASINLTKLESEANMGNNETKVQYRKLCETGEYRYFVNIINYLPFDGRKLIFMMSEDVNERMTSSEADNKKLQSDLNSYKDKLMNETQDITNAIYQINTLLEAGGDVKNLNTKDYINSILNNVSNSSTEMNKAMANTIKAQTTREKNTILIVDDSSIIRNTLKRVFANDFEILTAKDGNEAIKILNENVVTINDTPFNIVGVLLDLIMPEADGFTVLNYMKENNLFSKVPVAIISGDESKETRKKVYQYEIVDMLEKPFNTENIRRRISKIINLYMSSNNLQGVIKEQASELEQARPDASLEKLKEIVSQIINNIMKSKESTILKKIVRILSINLINDSTKYNLSSNFIDNMVNTCALYNIGGIAMSDDIVITSQTIKEEINYGLDIVSAYVKDPEEASVANNIVKYSCEMYNGKGYPDGLVGDTIPIEAQITNIAVKIISLVSDKSYDKAIKALNEEKNKYNPDLIKAVNDCKKEIKEVFTK